MPIHQLENMQIALADEPQGDCAIQVSIAVSLKRIADALEQPKISGITPASAFSAEEVLNLMRGDPPCDVCLWNPETETCARRRDGANPCNLQKTEFRNHSVCDPDMDGMKTRYVCERHDPKSWTVE